MASCMADYMEAVARRQTMEPPQGYGYKADVSLGVGCFIDPQSSCRVMEKPVCIPSGLPHHQGYVVLFGYCKEEGMVSILEGQLPPMLPCSKREPKEFGSLEAVADNFGMKDPKAAASNSQFCVAFRVPAELATKADTPGRDLWIVRFDQDIISPFLQVCKEGNVEKVKQGLNSGLLKDAEVVDELGVSALMMTATGGWEESCQALLQKGAKVNYQEPLAGRTPLMFAAQGGHSKAVKMLLDAKADTSLADKDGATALMWAAVAGHAETAKMLAAVSPQGSVNSDGLTAKQIAEKMGHKDTAAVLA